MISIHRYPEQTLVGDYMRAVFGLCLTAPMMFLINLDTWMAAMLLFIMLICVYFLICTIERHRTTVVADESGIVLKSFGEHAMSWDSLSSLSLTYYTLRGNRKKAGWMELTLKSDKTSVKFDSRITGFISLVQLAFSRAKSKKLPITEQTLASLRAIHVT